MNERKEIKFKALRVHEEGGAFSKSIVPCSADQLPAHNVLIRVHYAGLNYKDALSSWGHKGITRNFPHTPGVDAAGIVVEDKSGTFKLGEAVICTSYDLGMNTWGGFSEYISVPEGWVVPLPEKLSLYESMVLGTAAYTSALALYKMEQCGQTPKMGPLVVTGASGGVGSMAVALLAKAGYEVIASSGKSVEYDYLKSLGASKCIGREQTDDQSGRALLRPVWAGGIDNVGGNTLVTLLKSCKKEGCIASVGLVANAEFSMTVYPFILNGVNLLGIDSAETPLSLRKKIWEKLADEWYTENYTRTGRLVSLEEIPNEMEKMLKSQSKGRVVADLSH